MKASCRGNYIGRGSGVPSCNFLLLFDGFVPFVKIRMWKAGIQIRQLLHVVTVFAEGTADTAHIHRKGAHGIAHKVLSAHKEPEIDHHAVFPFKDALRLKKEAEVVVRSGDTRRVANGRLMMRSPGQGCIPPPPPALHGLSLQLSRFFRFPTVQPVAFITNSNSSTSFLTAPDTPLWANPFQCIPPMRPRSGSTQQRAAV